MAMMESLTLKLALIGQDTTEENLISLQDWIQEEHISGLKQVKPEIGAAEPGKMGIDPITVLSVVLASKAVIELVKAIHVWIQSTRPKVTVKIQLQENIFIEIQAENMPDMDSLLTEVATKVQLLEAKK